MIDQRIESSTEDIAEPRKHKKDTKTIDLWLRSVDKWLKICSVWKKESSLLQNLVTLTITGQDDSLTVLKSISRQIDALIRETEGLERNLLRFKEQTPLMHRNQVYYRSRYLESKKYIKALSSRYTQAKTRLLEELAMAYPLMIL